MPVIVIVVLQYGGVVGVSVGELVNVGVGVDVKVGVAVSVGVFVKMEVAVGVEVAVAVKVGEDVEEAIEADVAVPVRVAVGVEDAIAEVEVDTTLSFGVEEGETGKYTDVFVGLGSASAVPVVEAMLVGDTV